MRLLDPDAPAPTVAHVGELLSLLDEPSATVSAGGTETGGAEPFANAAYRRRLGAALLDMPASVITSRADSPQNGSSASNRAHRRALVGELAANGLLDRPSTTVNTGPRASLPGHHDNAQQPGHKSRGLGTRLTLDQRAALQGFPPGFVFHGKTMASRDKQVGNAVPSQLGEALGRAIRVALGRVVEPRA